MRLPTLFVCTLLCASQANSEDFDYFGANRQMVRNGVQAVLTCNGLFTSHRSLEQVFEQELAYLGSNVIGDADGGNYRVDIDSRMVSIGGDNGPDYSSGIPGRHWLRGHGTGNDHVRYRYAAGTAPAGTGTRPGRAALARR